jgi:hypothetical protein
MTIWTISIKTEAQHNTYCVDDKSKIKPYIDECIKEVKRMYKLKWLAVDFGVIREIEKDGQLTWNGGKFVTFGKVNRYEVH